MACRWIICLTIVGKGWWTPRFMCNDLTASESTKSSLNEVLLSLVGPLTTLWTLLSILTLRYAEWHHMHHLILFWTSYILLDSQWPLLSYTKFIKYKFFLRTSLVIRHIKYEPFDMMHWKRHSSVFIVFLPKMHHLNPIIRNNGPMRDKERLKNYHRLDEK